jgi:hypothetical protein
VILIVSHTDDDHAMGVLAVLERARHPTALVDTAQYPSNASLTQSFTGAKPSYVLETGGRTIDLGDCHCAWWRRPQPFTLEPGIALDAASFAYTECHEAIAGLWPSLEATWVNPPHFDEVAHHKPYQLATASRIGLPIPQTLITNDPSAARAFIDERGVHGVIYKTFLASETHWRETRSVRPDELTLLDSVRLAPVIFQEYVPAVTDIRATVVGDEIFAAAISPAPGGYDLDYRMDLTGARFAATKLPAAVERRLHELMDRLGLVYGAIDLRRTPGDEYVFLEVNPAGEWRFVEERTGQPITEAMACLLAALDDRRENGARGRQSHHHGRDRAAQREPAL